MEVVYRCCCGIDVHKKIIVACLNQGGEQSLREFGTTTSEIKSLANWLTESGCEMIAMESTGVFWKPLYNLFELMDLEAIPPYLYRGIGETHAAPFFPSLSFTAGYIPSELVRYVKDNNYKVIGLYRQPVISYVIMDALRGAGCEFVILDDEIDMLQAIKSEEELVEFRRITRIHDILYAACRCFVRPGRTEHEIAVDIKKAALDLSCEELNIMVGTGNPIGKHKPAFMQNRVVNKGDAMDLLIEVTGPGGLFGEVSRMWSIGEPSDDLRRAFDHAMEIQEYLASIAKPGLPASEIMRELHRFQDAHGYARETRLFAHSQGYDVVMRPCCMLNETMELRENMLLAIHPSLGNDKIFAMVTDNFLITPEGGKMLSNTPREIFVVD